MQLIKKIKKLILLFNLFLLINMAVVFAFDYVPTNQESGLPGEYLNDFAANARALGMGGAHTAVAVGSSAPYWNPAGLAQLFFQEGSFFYAPLFEGAGFNFASFSYPFDTKNFLSVAMAGLKIEDVDETNSDGEKIGAFNNAEKAYTVSYARKINEKLSAGVNLKLVNQNLYHYSDTGYGMDLGVLYKPLANYDFSLGAALQNVLAPTLKLKDETDVFPLNFKLGLAYKFLDNKLLCALDLDFLNLFPDKDLFEKNTSSPINWRFGGEYIFREIFVFRAGINYKELTCGFGLNRRNFFFDYALGIHNLEITHRFGIASRFGLLTTEKERIAIERTKEARMAEKYQMARTYFNEGNYDQALALTKEYMCLNPDDTSIQKLIGQINYQKRKQKAKEHCELALDYAIQGNKKASREEMQKAEELDSGCKKVMEEEYFKKARELISFKKYEEAQGALLKILILNPENKEAEKLLTRINNLLKFMAP